MGALPPAPSLIITKDLLLDLGPRLKVTHPRGLAGDAHGLAKPSIGSEASLGGSARGAH